MQHKLHRCETRWYRARQCKWDSWERSCWHTIQRKLHSWERYWYTMQRNSHPWKASCTQPNTNLIYNDTLPDDSSSARRLKIRMECRFLIVNGFLIIHLCTMKVTSVGSCITRHKTKRKKLIPTLNRIWQTAAQWFELVFAKLLHTQQQWLINKTSKVKSKDLYYLEAPTASQRIAIKWQFYGTSYH